MTLRNETEQLALEPQNPTTPASPDVSATKLVHEVLQKVSALSVTDLMDKGETLRDIEGNLFVDAFADILQSILNSKAITPVQKKDLLEQLAIEVGLPAVDKTKPLADIIISISSGLVDNYPRVARVFAVTPFTEPVLDGAGEISDKSDILAAQSLYVEEYPVDGLTSAIITKLLEPGRTVFDLPTIYTSVYGSIASYAVWLARAQDNFKNIHGKIQGTGINKALKNTRADKMTEKALNGVDLILKILENQDMVPNKRLYSMRDHSVISAVDSKLSSAGNNLPTDSPENIEGARLLAKAKSFAKDATATETFEGRKLNAITITGFDIGSAAKPFEKYEKILKEIKAHPEFKDTVEITATRDTTPAKSTIKIKLNKDFYENTLIKDYAKGIQDFGHKPEAERAAFLGAVNSRVAGDLRERVKAGTLDLNTPAGKEAAAKMAVDNTLDALFKLDAARIEYRRGKLGNKIMNFGEFAANKALDFFSVGPKSRFALKMLSKIGLSTALGSLAMGAGLPASLVVPPVMGMLFLRGAADDARIRMHKRWNKKDYATHLALSHQALVRSDVPQFEKIRNKSSIKNDQLALSKMPALKNVVAGQDMRASNMEERARIELNNKIKTEIDSQTFASPEAAIIKIMEVMERETEIILEKIEKERTKSLLGAAAIGSLLSYVTSKALDGLGIGDSGDGGSGDGSEGTGGGSLDGADPNNSNGSGGSLDGAEGNNGIGGGNNGSGGNINGGEGSGGSLDGADPNNSNGSGDGGTEGGEGSGEGGSEGSGDGGSEGAAEPDNPDGSTDTDGTEVIGAPTVEITGNFDTVARAFNENRTLIDHRLGTPEDMTQINHRFSAIADNLNGRTAEVITADNTDVMLRSAQGNILGDIDTGDSVTLTGRSDIFRIEDPTPNGPVAEANMKFFEVTTAEGDTRWISGTYIGLDTGTSAGAGVVNTATEAAQAAAENTTSQAGVNTATEVAQSATNFVERSVDNAFNAANNAIDSAADNAVNGASSVVPNQPRK